MYTVSETRHYSVCLELLLDLNACDLWLSVKVSKKQKLVIGVIYREKCLISRAVFIL